MALYSCAEPNSRKFDLRATLEQLLIHTLYLGQTKLKSLQVRWAWVQVKLQVYHQNLKMVNEDKLA